MKRRFDPRESGWWQTPQAVVALVLAFSIPLLWPAIPPLADLPNHMARFRIELAIDESPYLKQWFSFEWKPVANLGFDLLIVPMARLFGLEPGMKLLVLMVPPLTVAGMLWLAREIHGRIPPTALFALPLAYCFPFQYGFLNFTLGMALVFLACALWLRMGRLGRNMQRALVFLPVSALILIVHSQAWGLFGLIIFAIELTKARQDGDDFRMSILKALLLCLPLAPPIMLILFWFTGSPPGPSGQAFEWIQKFHWMMSILRNSSMVFDIICAVVLYVLIYLGIRRDGLRLDPRLGWAALLLLITYILMPAMVMGSAYNDMRMMAYIVAMAILAIEPITEKREWHRALALAGLLFIAVRLGVQTWFYVKLDRAYQSQLAALDHIPRGARIFSLVDLPCFGRWDSLRFNHLAEMAIARREAFVNGQWLSIPMLTVHYPAEERFVKSPSHQLFPENCRGPGTFSLEYVLEHLPMRAFDYLWLIDLPPENWPRKAGLTPIWHGRTGILYRIEAEAAINRSSRRARAAL